MFINDITGRYRGRLTLFLFLCSFRPLRLILFVVCLLPIFVFAMFFDTSSECQTGIASLMLVRNFFVVVVVVVAEFYIEMPSLVTASDFRSNTVL